MVPSHFYHRIKSTGYPKILNILIETGLPRGCFDRTSDMILRSDLSISTCWS